MSGLSGSWESLGEDAEGFSRFRARDTCAMVKFLDMLKASEGPQAYGAVVGVMLRPELTHSSIVAALKRRGHDVPYSTVQRHRTGRCCCSEEAEA